jgi:hypothetical protein
VETVSLEERFGIGVGGGQLGYSVMHVEGGELVGTETEVGFLECCADQQVDAARVCARDSDRVGQDVVTRGGEEQCTTVARVDTVVIAQVRAGCPSEQSYLRAQQVGGRGCAECVCCRGSPEPDGECLREFFGELEPAGHLVVSARDDRGLRQRRLLDAIVRASETGVRQQVSTL